MKKCRTIRDISEKVIIFLIMCFTISLFTYDCSAAAINKSKKILILYSHNQDFLIAKEFSIGLKERFQQLTIHGLAD